MFSRPSLFAHRMRCYGVAFCLLLVAPLAGRAAILEGLYEVTVPVLNQSDKERRLALMNALDQVLVRASGQTLPALQANSVLQSQRSKAEDYLLEYRYGTAKQTGPAAPGAAPGAELTAKFAPHSIRNLLAQAGLALWPRNRPTVMVWWQVEEKGQRRLMGDGLRSLAVQRGLPVVLPMNDLQDKLAQEALWGFDTEAIAQVAGRYGITAMLVGRGTGNAASGWQGQWLFYFQGQVIRIPAAPEPGPTEAVIPASWLEGEILQDLEAAGIDGVIDILLQRYGVVLAGPARQAELVVSGVNSFEDYSQVLRYVQALEAIRTVSLAKAEKQVLHYQLVFDGDPAVLQELLGLGGVLVAESESLAVNGDASSILRYRFQRQ